MCDFFTPVKLVPVSQWVYDLFEVKYFTDETMTEQVGGSRYFASSYEGHLETDIGENWPNSRATYFSYDTIKENVGHPRTIGHFYGRSMSEDGRSHGKRVAEALGLYEH